MPQELAHGVVQQITTAVLWNLSERVAPDRHRRTFVNREA